MATEKKRFSKINIEISNICNLQCSFCPEVIRSKKLMSVELFKHIIAEVRFLTNQVCFHLMGDPLVHPHLNEFVNICEENGVQIFLVTNGVLLRDKQSAILLREPFRQVNFSLHSFHDNFGDKDSSQYLKNIFEFTEKAFKERPDLFINYRLWNLKETRGSGTQNAEMLSRIEERFGYVHADDVDVQKAKKSVRIKNKLYLHFDTEFTWPSLDIPMLGSEGTCYGLKSHFGVLVDGTVVPCCLDKEGNIPLGNIADKPVLEILESPRVKNILKGFRNRKLTEELCKRCQYIERF